MSSDGENREPKQLPTKRFITGSNITEYRDNLVDNYRQKHQGVLQKINENAELTANEILSLIAKDILVDSESLLGTQLLFSEEGNLRDATTITIKRSELLKSVAEIVAKQKELNQKASDIDLNGPAFMIFQKMCFDKMIDSLEELEMDEEMTQLILSKWSAKMENWGKEMKQKLDELAQ